MSLESFKRTSLTWNRANDTLNKTPIEIVAGDANARTLELRITNDGYTDALTGYDVRLYWSYADASSVGTATFIADKLNQGIYTLTFPTEMTVPGTILANISLENKDEKSVIVSKQITFNVLTSQLNETAVEVTNRIDEFKQLLLTIYPNSVATELSAQKAQIDANASNILLKANNSDLTNLKNQIDQISSELTSFGITPTQINTIQSLLAAIENDATDADVAAVITSLNTIKSQVDAMANGSYTAKANKTDLDSLTQTVNNQGASIATKRDINAVDTIAQGGTNANTRPAAFNNLSFIGTNPITLPANDTPANWVALGSGYAWYTQNNALNNQPGQYGFLIQYVYPRTNELFQIFSLSPTGEMYYRKANGTGWRGRTDDGGTWTRLSDSQNPLPLVKADASSTGTAYTITNSTLPTSLPWGYTFKFIPNVNSSTANATLAINGGTAYPFCKIDTYTGAFIQVSSTNTSSGFLSANKATTITYSNGMWILNDEPIPNATAITGVLPTANGGTGTSDGVINTIAYANSADGTNGFTTVYPNLNLLKYTSSDLQTAPDSSDINNGGIIRYFSSDELGILAGDQFTVSAFIHNTTTHTVNLVIWTNGGIVGVGTGVPAGTDGYSTINAYRNPSSFSIGDIAVRAYTENTAISGAQYKELKLEKGSVATPYMPSSSEVTTADYPKYVGFSNVIKPNKTSSDYNWLPMGLVSIDSATGLLKPATIGVDYAQAHPVGSVISNTSSASSGYAVGSWSLLGSTTVYPNFNLLTGTSNQKSNDTIPANFPHINSKHSNISVTAGEKFVYQALFTSDNTIDLAVGIDFYSGATWKKYSAGNFVRAGNSGRSILAFQIPEGIDNIVVNIGLLTHMYTEPIIIYWQEEKLEQGSTATPYMISQQEVTATGYPTYVESTTLYYWKRTG